MEKTKKTYKREVAALLAAFLCFIAYRASVVDSIETLKIIVWPIMLFVGAAYGMQWASKQTNLTGMK